MENPHEAPILNQDLSVEDLTSYLSGVTGLDDNQVKEGFPVLSQGLGSKFRFTRDIDPEDDVIPPIQENEYVLKESAPGIGALRTYIVTMLEDGGIQIWEVEEEKSKAMILKSSKE